jgi:ubiquinone/menaquinone biosynthesis C-methylase UbiE
MHATQLEREYPLGDTASELKRLSTQASFCETFTWLVFQSAGLASGMRVLDVGSGSGDVAFLAARMVGPAGGVVGTDRSSSAVYMARERARELGLKNVCFLEGDPAEMHFDRTFDAVVGRSVLMYYRDPADTLKKLARSVRNGGIMAFQEIDCGSARAVPRLALYDKHNEWVSKTLTMAGTDLNMGSKLYATFLAAGFPPPSMRVDTPIVGAYDSGAPMACHVLCEVLRSLKPMMEKFGVTTASELDVDSFASQLFVELAAGGGVMIWNSIIGAWARKGE